MIKLLIDLFFDILQVTLKNIEKISYHIIMMILTLMTVSTLSGNQVNVGEFNGFNFEKDDTVLPEYNNEIYVQDTGDIIENMYGHPVTPLNTIHYIAGSQVTGNGMGTIRVGQMFDFYYYGRDYVGSCGADVYAPFDSILTYQSNIGGGTPQLTFTSIDGNVKVHTMHLDAVQTSGQVQQGELVGYVDKKGAYSGGVCHGHDSIYVNGYLEDIEYYQLKNKG